MQQASHLVGVLPRADDRGQLADQRQPTGRHFAGQPALEERVLRVGGGRLSLRRALRDLF